MTKKKNITYLSIIIVLVVGLVIAISYAYWTKTQVQETTNVVTSGCLNFSLEGENEIELLETIPISDNAGMQLTPYTFTVTNTCNGEIAFNVNLESLAATTLQNSSIRVAIDNTHKLYSSYDEVETLISGSKEARKLTSGVLTRKDESVTYNLRVWIDKDAPITEQNKRFESKITITTGDSSSGAGLTVDELIALNEMVEMDQPATTQLGATKDWRYTGATPNNYIIFNNEMWRIIGVFNVDDGTGTLEKRIKIVRNVSLSYYLGWDTNNTNNWTTSSLKTYLNGDYYNSLTTEAKSKIKEAKWYLGGWSSTSIKPSDFYNYERGTTVYSGHQTNWTGTIALIYMSDYGYAVGGDNRTTCLNTNMSAWDTDNPSCRGNDWIHNAGIAQWTIVPYSSNTNNVFFVRNYGNINDSNTNNYIVFRPSLYLKPDITLTGSGTEINPYIIH